MLKNIKLKFQFLLFILIVRDSHQEVDHYNYDDFYTYAWHKTQETNKKNDKLFNASLNSCEYKPLSMMTNESVALSDSNEYSLDLESYSPGKLILLDDSLLALLSSINKSIRIYDLNLYNSNLMLIREIFFHNERPFDFCTDKVKYVFLVFQNENRIAKYHVKKVQSNGQIQFKRVKYITEAGLNPTAISCTKNFVYVSEGSQKQIRVYDKRLNLIDIINPDGVIVNVHKSIIVERNLKVFMDGFDAVALFDNKNLFNNSQNTCHFYKNLMCVQDVSIYTNIENKSLIYVADNCDKEIKEFVYSNRSERIKLNKLFKINFSDEVISMNRNSFNQMILVTNNPNRLLVFKLNGSI